MHTWDESQRIHFCLLLVVLQDMNGVTNGAACISTNETFMIGAAQLASCVSAFTLLFGSFPCACVCLQGPVSLASPANYTVIARSSVCLSICLVVWSSAEHCLSGAVVLVTNRRQYLCAKPLGDASSVGRAGVCIEAPSRFERQILPPRAIFTKLVMQYPPALQVPTGPRFMQHYRGAECLSCCS